MATVLVQCRVCGRRFRLAAGRLIVPVHPHQEHPGVRCTGSGTVGARGPE